MNNALGLKDGKPIVGSVWSWMKEYRWRVIGAPSSDGSVPMEGVGTKMLASNPLGVFLRAGEALVSLPPGANTNEDGELAWTPILRSMLKWEESARAYEARGDHGNAKMARVTSAALVEIDATIAAEESALKEHRYILKADLKALTPGDRACYEMKGLKEFKQHTEAAAYLYWD